MCADIGAMFPMIEMARDGHFKFISDVLLVYNGQNNINDHKISKALQRATDLDIRSKPRYPALREPIIKDGSDKQRYNIGLLIVATGKYTQFIPGLIDSARKYFCTDHNVTFFVFTDSQIPAAPDIVRIEQPRLGWPYDTMMRYEMYTKNAELYKNMDYLFACDADMLFVDTVGNEILSNRIGTIHPGYYGGNRGTYETNPISKAYVAPHEGKYYFAGGLNGGSRDCFLAMANAITKQIYDDLAKGHIAVWHDESHVNRYLIDNPPTLLLSPSYCYPERWGLPFQKKLLALDKNHQKMRE